MIVKRHHSVPVVLILAILLAVGQPLAGPAAATPPSTTFPNRPTVADLVDASASQPRDISLPNSRIVTNPRNMFDLRSSTEQTTGPDLPLSAGYFVDRRAPRIDDMLLVNQRPRTTPSALKRPTAGAVDTMGSATGWVFGGANTFTFANGVGTLTRATTTGDTYANAGKDFTVDLDAHPRLRISVRSAAEGWGLKVNAGSGSDIVLQPTTSVAGVFDYDVAAVTGWSGTRTFAVRLFAIGYNKPAVFDEIRFQTAPVTSPTAGFSDNFDGTLSSAWTPSSAVAASTSGGQLTLTVPGTSGTSYGYVNRVVTANIDRYPYLEVTTVSAADSWTLKIIPAGQPTMVVQETTSGLGTFAYNLPALTGLHGSQTFTIQIMVNGYQSPAVFDNIQVAAPNGPADSFNEVFAGTSLDPGWSTSGSSASVSGGMLTLTNTSGGTYGKLSRTFTVDVDVQRRIRLVIPAAGNSWALRLDNNLSDSDDGTYLQPARERLTGSFEFDIPDTTGWHGVQTFTIRLYVSGPGQQLTVDDVSIGAVDASPWLVGAATRSTSWAPHQLTFAGTYPNGGTVNGRDLFHDVNSLGRVFTVAGLGSTDLQLSGHYDGTLSYDAASNTITVLSADFLATSNYYRTIALPAGITPVLRYYRDRTALLRGGPARATPSTTNGYWTATLTGLGATTEIRLGVGFALASEGSAVSRSRALAAATTTAAANDAATRAAYWNGVLASVPNPVNFDIHAVSAGTVTAAAVRQLYFRSWIFTQAQVLPPMPEADTNADGVSEGNPYPQVATGKASLYIHSVPAASASWDSVMGMQLLAYLDPATAWDALAGLAANVAADGRMPGEYLPSREMQTAWILYATTGDLAELSSVYPALRRSLIYKAARPSYTSPANVKDSAFVGSAVNDMVYAESIAGVLGLTADVTDWQSRRATLSSSLATWFWSSPTSMPVKTYDTTTGVRTPGVTMSVTPLLHVPGLDATRAASTVALFDATYDASEPFAGYGVNTNDVRYGITSYTIYGLLDHGYVDRANVLSNAILRDITRTNTLSERYQWDTGVAPFAAGNQPSLFGAASVVDAVWMNNGYRFDLGTPSFVALPGAEGGIAGLAVRGRTLDLTINEPGGTLGLAGDYVVATSSCTSQTIASGQTITLAPACRAA